MTPKGNYTPSGVVPAVLLPFKEDLSIDEGAYRQHLRQVAATPHITAITANSHSTEVASCSFKEQQRVLEITLEEVGDRLPVVCGVYSDGSLAAAKIARMAQAGGASALLVFPPGPFIRGGQLRPAMALAHFKTIAQASDLPLVVFQYPIPSGQGYPLDTLLRLVEEVPTIRAIKDGCGDPVLHQRHIAALQSLRPTVNVLTTHSAWLLSSLVVGCAGLLSGSGSIIPDLHVALFRAVAADDLALARKLAARVQLTANVFYAHPLTDMHNRMKEAMVYLGRMPCAAVRPPLAKLEQPEIERINQAMQAAGIERDGAKDLSLA
jgi:4-hydroxy-tetrahydrodipicolinate synthase